MKLGSSFKLFLFEQLQNEGILGLDLFPILVGTLPVLVLIVPSVLTGSFLFIGGLEKDGLEIYPWADTAAGVATSLIAAICFYLTLSAANAVKVTLEEDHEAIAAIPFDEAVVAADAEAEKKRKAYRRVTIWEDVPILLKITLCLSVLCMTVCFYMLLFVGSKC